MQRRTPFHEELARTAAGFRECISAVSTKVHNQVTSGQAVHEGEEVVGDELVAVGDPEVGDPGQEEDGRCPEAQHVTTVSDLRHALPLLPMSHPAPYRPCAAGSDDRREGPGGRGRPSRAAALSRVVRGGQALGGQGLRFCCGLDRSRRRMSRRRSLEEAAGRRSRVRSGRAVGRGWGSGDAGELAALAKARELRGTGAPGPGLGSAGGVPVLQRGRRPCLPDILRASHRSPPGAPGCCRTCAVRAVAQGRTPSARSTPA